MRNGILRPLQCFVKRTIVSLEHWYGKRKQTNQTICQYNLFDTDDPELHMYSRWGFNCCFCDFDHVKVMVLTPNRFYYNRHGVNGWNFGCRCNPPFPTSHVE